MILNELKIEYLELKEKMKIKEIEMLNLSLKNNKVFYSKDEYLSLNLEYLMQKKLIEELNEEFKKILEQIQQKNEILNRNGIKY